MDLKSHLLTLIIILFSVFAPAMAQPPQYESDPRTEQLQRQVEARRAVLERAKDAMARADSEADLLNIREDVRQIRSEALNAIAPLVERREERLADLDRLGPAPAESEPAETPEIAETRAALNAQLSETTAIIQQAELNIAEAERLLLDIADLRRERFYGALRQRGTLPFMPALLQAAGQDVLDGAEVASREAQRWWASRQEAGRGAATGAIIALSVVAGALMFGPVRRWTQQQVLRRILAMQPTPGRRAAAALVRILTKAVPGVIAGALVVEALRSQGVITAESDVFSRSIWFAFVALLMAEAGATAVFSPATPGWRLMPLQTGSAFIIRLHIIFLVFVFVIDQILSAGAALFGSSADLALVQSAMIAALLALGLLGLSRQRLWTLSEERADAFSNEAKAFGKGIRRIVMFLGLGILIATALGYVALGYYVATRTFMLGGLAALALFARLLLQEGLQAAARRFALVEATETDAPRERLIFYWLGVIVDTMLLLAIIPPAALIIGADWADVRDLVRDAVFGFRIGSVTISVAEIFFAFLAFFVILSLTRFVQRTAETRFFPQTRLDTGVRSSLKTLIGYVGLVIGVLTAVGMLGFELGNLAIIAGALSVGIGFGLQSIVNNFVSGLILLFERPIKVGDWIVTSSGEGIVQRISVRSTEIMTFERSSVIVPNSELITNAVTNWTHKNSLARVTVPVGVSYSADPEEVLQILKRVTDDYPECLTTPAPLILFTSYGESSLDFQVRVYIADVMTSLRVQTELHVLIFKALKEANIEIPFPQRDLHFRSSDIEGVARPAGPAPGAPAGE